MGRGLLERVAARRGLLGGSIWKLTVTAQRLLKVEKGVNGYGISIGSDGGSEFLLERHTGGDGEDIYASEGDSGSSWSVPEESDDWY
jgi:hypothetical protein